MSRQKAWFCELLHSTKQGSVKPKNGFAQIAGGIPEKQKSRIARL